MQSEDVDADDCSSLDDYSEDAAFAEYSGSNNIANHSRRRPAEKHNKLLISEV